MGLRDFLKSTVTLFRLARKPTRREFMLALRITLLGVSVIGLIAFIIRFLALALQSL